MSLQILFPSFLSTFLSSDLADVSDELAEKFHHNISATEKHYWTMLAGYYWKLENTRYTQQKSKSPEFFLSPKLKRRRLESAEEEHEQTLEQLTQNFFKIAFMVRWYNFDNFRQSML
jgi:hypothetical protein